MGSVFTFVIEWAVATWDLLLESSFFLVIGFLLAGLIRAFVSERNLARLIGRKRHTQVFKAALVGVPLPLCSCSVLPVAHQLRESGLSKGGTVSFLISTPESGVDSILLTYSLTDPVLTVARPVTAFVTATAAGLVENTVDAPEPPPEAIGADCHDDCCEAEAQGEDISNQSVPRKISGGIQYAFTTLIDDLAVYLLFGYALAGVVGVVLGGELLSVSEGFRTGWPGYLAALVVGLPLYICATSSTPLAAALLAHGFSPGAILVFLIVGPATNIASLAVVGKMLKKWSLVRYLLIIVGMALLAGVALDAVYRMLGVAGWYRYVTGEHGLGFVDAVSSILITALILMYSWRRLQNRITGA